MIGIIVELAFFIIAIAYAPTNDLSSLSFPWCHNDTFRKLKATLRSQNGCPRANGTTISELGTYEDFANELHRACLYSSPGASIRPYGTRLEDVLMGKGLRFNRHLVNCPIAVARALQNRARMLIAYEYVSANTNDMKLQSLQREYNHCTHCAHAILSMVSPELMHSVGKTTLCIEQQLQTISDARLVANENAPIVLQGRGSARRTETKEEGHTTALSSAVFSQGELRPPASLHSMTRDEVLDANVGHGKVLCPDVWKCVGSYFLRDKLKVPFLIQSLYKHNSSLPENAPVTTAGGRNFHDQIIYRMNDPVIPRTLAWKEYISATQYEDYDGKGLFSAGANPISLKHWNQRIEDAKRLRHFHKNTVLFGEIDPLELLLRLAYVSDRSDVRVGLVSQWVHTLQVFQAMKLDAITDREFLFAGIIHDVGKLVSLVEEDAHADGCSKGLDYEKLSPGQGLDHLTLLFDHHDFGADKMRRYVSPRVYRLMRYHCFQEIILPFPKLLEVATDEERQHIEEIRRFFAYDQLSKSMWVMPNVRMSQIRSLVREFLPPRIIF